MNFAEACQAMLEGNAVKCFYSGGLYIKRVNGKLLQRINQCDDWTQYGIPLDMLFDEVFEIYEEPKPEVKKGLWEKYDNTSGTLSKHIISFSDSLIGFGKYYLQYKNKKERDCWFAAFLTFIELKEHPLAVKAIGGKKQYLINTDCDGTIYISYYSEKNTVEERFSCMSPMFESESDALQAVNDLGEERLMCMFKTFQGIYE